MSRHPLDPLSADEISAVSTLLRRDTGVDATWRFISIAAVEPPKATVRAWRPGDALDRRGAVVLLDRTRNETVEATVNLTAETVESFTVIPGVTSNFTVDEFHDVAHAVLLDERALAALASRGITDPSLVVVDVWAYGGELMPPQWRDRRLGWADLWVRATPDGNPYAHPISGLKVIVDLTSLEVLDIEDEHDHGMPAVDGEYAPALRQQALRDDLKPLHITQPDGGSFTLEGTLLRWQNWTMRLGFNFREGPVIHQVSYNDHGRERDVAYRMSFAEMVVPYRDASFDHYRRTAFDIGEWGLGFMTTSLELGCDCLGEITYVDAVVNDTRGEPVTISQAICLHEEDNAVLWKHVDAQTGSEVRRMRRMVVSCHATVANYEYLVYWRFYQDGNIECEVRATGLMVTTPFDATAGSPATGTVVDESTYAPHHQHFLVARLDLDVDGQDNTVVEVDAFVPPISSVNPYGLAMGTRGTVIESEIQAARDFSWETQRVWKVQSASATNAFGAPTAYKLVPGAAIPPLLDPLSVVLKRAPVVGHTLWVTAHDDAERWPAGEYPTQSDRDTGMSTWVADDAPLVGTDVVLWYVFGIHHITRVEDWPIMPADTISFWLKPFGFFDQNPALDVPPNSTVNRSHCH